MKTDNCFSTACMLDWILNESPTLFVFFQSKWMVPENKTAVPSDFVQMWWREGEGPIQIFWHLFISAFFVNKRRLFPPKCQ